MRDQVKADSADVPRLVEQWRQGDQDAATALYNRYQSRLLLLVSGRLNERLRRRVDPDELVQSIMKSAFRVTGQRDIGCADETGFWKWLVTVALNKTFKRIERETAGMRDPQREAGGDTVLGERILDEPTPDDAVEVSDLLEKILDRLSDQQKRILLAKLEGRSQTEIAEELKVAPKTVQRNGHAIRKAAMAVMGPNIPLWLVADEPSMADQFQECLEELVSEWLPKKHGAAFNGLGKLKLIELFEQAQPDVRLLDGVRSGAKARGEDQNDEMPPSICSVIYQLAVATARTKLGEKLSSDNDQRLKKRTEITLKEPWLSTWGTKALQDFLKTLSN